MHLHAFSLHVPKHISHTFAHLEMAKEKGRRQKMECTSHRTALEGYTPLWYRHIQKFVMSLWWQDQVLDVLLKVETNSWSIILNYLWYWLLWFSSVPVSARTRFAVIKTIPTPPNKVLTKPLIKSFLLCQFHWSMACCFDTVSFVFVDDSSCSHGYAYKKNYH